MDKNQTQKPYFEPFSGETCHYDRIFGLIGGWSSLPESEQKSLLHLIQKRGVSFEHIARLRGEHATTVSRRFRRLMNRLDRRTVAAVSRRAAALGPLERTVLFESVLCGRSQQTIAARLGVSRYQVRKVLARFSRNCRRAAACRPERSGV